MNPSLAVALFVAGPLVLLGAASGYGQVRGLRRLAARKHVPSDEYAYLRNRYRRRTLVAGVMALIGALIAGSYLSGMERRADRIAENRDPADAAPAEDAKKEIPEGDKQFVKLWGTYWILVLVLVFVLLGLAVIDAWATRRYWFKIYREMRDDHNTKLRRDLAVYRQQQADRGRGRRGVIGPDPDDTPTPE